MHRMNTYKRRIVYFTDEEWDVLKAVAKERHQTISSVLRDFWEWASKPAERIIDVLTDPEPPSRGLTQSDRDAILRRISKH